MKRPLKLCPFCKEKGVKRWTRHIYSHVSKHHTEEQRRKLWSAGRPPSLRKRDDMDSMPRLMVKVR